MSAKIAVAFVVAIALLRGLAAGQSLDSASAYVEVRAGNLPIVLLAPHGGTLKPAGARDRTFGRMAQDANTAPLTDLMADALEKRFGGRPHVVKCLLHRVKVDCNRDLNEAAQGDPVAVATWRRYHSAAETACKQVARSHGVGLLFDIHGHRHELPRVELGYLISGADLDMSDEALDRGGELASRCSIRDLDKRSPARFSELLRGKTSLGGLLEARGFPSIPSPANPTPHGAPYFSGLYDIIAHGSRDGGSISAIQVECPWAGVRDTVANQRRFAAAFAEAIGLYFEVHLNLKPRPVKSAAKAQD